MPLAALLPAIVSVGGAVGGALISSHATNRASQAATDAANANNALQQRTYDSNKALIQPGVDRGNQAAEALQGFLGLGGDPAKSQAALQTYLNSTGYNFARDQGLSAVTNSKAVSGLLNSGGAIKALDAYGTGLANQYGQQYVGNLNDVANRGVNSVNALTGAATGNANAQSANNNSAATTVGNAAIAGANSTNSLIGSALTAYGLSRGQSSYSGGAPANPFSTPPISI